MEQSQLWGFPGGSDGKESACNARDPSSIPGSGRSPEEGNGNPLQHSCLENPMDRGAWQAAVHGGHRVRHDSVTSTFTFQFILTPQAESPTWPPTIFCRKLHLFTHSRILPIRNHRMAPGAQRGPERSPHPLLPSTSQTGSSFPKPWSMNVLIPLYSQPGRFCSQTHFVRVREAH